MEHLLASVAILQRLWASEAVNIVLQDVKESEISLKALHQQKCQLTLSQPTGKFPVEINQRGPHIPHSNAFLTQVIIERLFHPKTTFTFITFCLSCKQSAQPISSQHFSMHFRQLR